MAGGKHSAQATISSNEYEKALAIATKRAWVRKIPNPPEVASDIVHKLFLEFDATRGVPFSAFVALYAGWRCVDKLRKEKPKDQESWDPDEVAPEMFPSPEKALEEKEERERISPQRRALAQLSTDAGYPRTAVERMRRVRERRLYLASLDPSVVRALEELDDLVGNDLSSLKKTWPKQIARFLVEFAKNLWFPASSRSAGAEAMAYVICRELPQLPKTNDEVALARAILEHWNAKAKKRAAVNKRFPMARLRREEAAESERLIQFALRRAGMALADANAATSGLRKRRSRSSAQEGRLRSEASNPDDALRARQEAALAEIERQLRE
jgi:hypothetical protein